MAINKYNKPIKTNYQDTYVSQHVDLPYQAIAQKMARDQGDYDTSKAEYDATSFSDDLLKYDNPESYRRAQELEKGMSQALEEADGDYRSLNGYINNAKKEWSKYTSSTEHKLAEQNKANHDKQRERVQKDGGSQDSEYMQFKDYIYGKGGGAFGENQLSYENWNTIGNHNWLDEAAKNVGLLKASGSTTSKKGLSPDEMYKTFKKTGGKGVSAQEYRDMMTASLNANEDFETYVNRELEMIQSRLENPLTDDQIKQYKQKKINDVIGNTDKALAWKEVVDESGIDLTSFGNSVKKDKYDEEQSVINYTYNKKNPGDVFNQINKNEDGNANPEDYRKAISMSANGFLHQGALFGENQAKSEAVINDISDKVFETTELSDRQQMSLISYFAGNGANSGLTAKERNALQNAYNDINPDKRKTIETAAKKQMKTNAQYTTASNDIIDQAAEQGFVNKNDAEFYKNYGDRNVARDRVSRLNDKEFNKEIKKYDAVNRLLSGNVVTVNSKYMFKLYDQANDKWETLRYDQLSDVEKEQFQKMEGASEGKLHLRKPFNIDEYPAIKSNMPVFGTGATQAGVHFEDHSSMWTGGSDILPENSRDFYKDRINEKVVRSGASTTEHAKTSGNIQKGFKYNTKTPNSKPNVFDIAMDNGEIKDASGNKVNRDALRQKFVEEFKESDQWSSDSKPKDINQYVDDKMHELFDVPGVSYDSSNPLGVKIVYGNGAYTLNIGGPNDKINTVPNGDKKGQNLISAYFTLSEWQTSVNDQMNSEASQSISGKLPLATDEKGNDMVWIQSSKDGSSQDVFINGDQFGFKGQNYKINNPTVYRNSLTEAQYLKASQDNKSLEKMYGTTDLNQIAIILAKEDQGK